MITEQPRISAFDLATASAVAFGCLGETPRTEAWDLGKRTAIGLRGLSLFRRVIRHCESFKPQKAAIEAPLPPHILVKMNKSDGSARLSPGLCVVAESALAFCGVENELIERQKALFHFTGRARFRDSKMAKKACMARCWQLGWKVQTEDEADACCLWDYMAARENPRYFVKLAVERPMFAMGD